MAITPGDELAIALFQVQDDGLNPQSTTATPTDLAGIWGTRHRALVDQAIANYGLPQPDFAITDVGTKIHAREQDAWRVWSDWEEEIETDWVGHDREAISRLFHDLNPLRPQEPAKRNTHKLSYYLPVQVNRQV